MLAPRPTAAECTATLPKTPRSPLTNYRRALSRVHVAAVRDTLAESGYSHPDPALASHAAHSTLSGTHPPATPLASSRDHTYAQGDDAAGVGTSGISHEPSAPQYAQAAGGPHRQRPVQAQAYTAAPPPPPASSAASEPPWFAGWTPSHMVGIFLGFCTLMLSAAIFAVVQMFQPVLKAAEKAMKEMEEACEDMQRSTEEWDATSLMMQRDLPPALEAMEDAAREFEMLGTTMRSVLGPFSGSAGKARVQKGADRRRAAESGESGESSSDERQAAKEMTDELATAVKKGDVGNLPVKLFLDMSNNFQPLFREWRARFWSLGWGNRQPVPAARLTSGPASRLSFDSDDDGSREPRVSPEVAAAFAAAGGAGHVPSGAPVLLSRDASGAGVVMCVGVSAPTHNGWGAQRVVARSNTAETPAASDTVDSAADLGALHGRVYANGAQNGAHNGTAAGALTPVQLAETVSVLHKAQHAPVHADVPPVAEAAPRDASGRFGGAKHMARVQSRGDEGSPFEAARSAVMPYDGMLRSMMPSGLRFDGLGLRLFGRN